MKPLRYRSCRRGAGLVEYGLAVGLIAVAAVVAVDRTGGSVANLFDGVSTSLSDLPVVSAGAPSGGAAAPAPSIDGETCKTLYDSGVTTDGVYTLDPDGDGTGFDAYCNMTDNGGGWTLAVVAVGNTLTEQTHATPDAVGQPLDPSQGDNARLSDADWTSLGDITWFDFPTGAGYNDFYVRYASTNAGWRTGQDYEHPFDQVEAPACSSAPSMSPTSAGRAENAHPGDCYTSHGVVGISIDGFTGAINATGGLAWIR